MNVSLATILALAAALLMAVAIFAPRRTPVMPPREPATVAGTSTNAVPAEPPRWPLLVDPSAAACDTATRIDLVEALAALDTDWANDVLRRARDEETDPAVVLALAAGERIRRGRADVWM